MTFQIDGESGRKSWPCTRHIASDSAPTKPTQKHAPHESVALKVALEEGVVATRRDVFLDNERSVEAVTHELQRLKAMARKKGYAVGIGHPFPETLEVLERELPKLEADGFEVVTIGRILQQQWNRI